MQSLESRPRQPQLASCNTLASKTRRRFPIQKRTSSLPLRAHPRARPRTHSHRRAARHHIHMDDLPATPIRSPRSPGKKLTLAEDEVARLRARLEEEEAWQAKILKRLEAKAAEDKKNESKYESTARALDDCAADLEASRQRCAVLDDDNASLRDELSAAHDRAADAEERARFAEQQRTRNLEALAQSMAEVGLLKHEVERLKRSKSGGLTPPTSLEGFLRELGLPDDYAPRLRRLGAKRVFDLAFLRDEDLTDVTDAERRILRRCAGRLRALVDVLGDDVEDRDPVGCSSITAIGSPDQKNRKKAQGDDCCVM